MNVGLGVVYASNLGDAVILPAVTFAYSTDKFVLNIDFPVKAEVEALVANGKWRPVVGVTFPAASYYLQNADVYVQTQATVGYAGVRYRVFDLLYLYAAYQATLNNTYKAGARDNRTEIGNLSNEGRFVIGLNIQVAKFIPYVREEK